MQIVSKDSRDNYIFTDVAELDITNLEAIRKMVKEQEVKVIINCAAYTNVNGCETDGDIAFKINAIGPRNLSIAAKETGAKLVQISTDYIFSGDTDKHYDEFDEPSPMSAYGKTKYLGECFVKEFADKYFILRTAWLYGEGKNFVKTMLALAEKNDKVQVVNDQFGSPTYTYDLARLLVDMIQTDKYGIYHATNEGICTWYEFACEIFRQAGLTVDVAPVTADQYPAKAKRPSNSRMSKDKLEEMGFERLPSWQDALSRYLKEITW